MLHGDFVVVVVVGSCRPKVTVACLGEVCSDFRNNVFSVMEGGWHRNL